MDTYLEIYGLSLKLDCQKEDLSKELIRPFKGAKSFENKHPTVTVSIHEENISYDRLPQAVSSFSTPRNIVFNSKEGKIIDYFGKGIVTESDDRSLYHIYSTDKNFLTETFYLLVTSAISRFCDQKGYLRIHSLGISCRDKAFIFLMPPGFGKSTLAMALLENKEYRLISDDCPLYKKKQILPFPVRIGVMDKKSIPHIPEKFVYRIDRMEFGTKYFIDLDFLNGQIEKRPLHKIVIFKTRMVLGGTPCIKKTSKSALISSLMRDAVVGIGLYQGMEFIFKNGAQEILLKIPVLIKRLIQAAGLLAQSAVYDFTLTRDTAQNTKAFKEFTDNLDFK